MAQIDRIKELREIEGWSVNKIAKTVKHSWATVKKYADEPVDVQTRGRRTRTSPVIGPYEHIIDAWLAEDQRRPVKQRRTAEKLYRDLCDLGYEGSSRTVRRYVRQRKLELKAAANGQFVRLHHPPGTAQVDFGEFRAIYRGKEVTCYHLTMTFPYSNAHAAVVLPADNTVCFLHGLATLFEIIGGVPTHLWLDNLSPAVKKVLQGPDRELTDMFRAFQWHYRFQPIFCNVGRGHEKGSVENKVGYVRRNFLSPIVCIDDFATFNAELNEQLIQDMQRPHYEKNRLIAELWEEDRERLLMLPNSPFEAVQLETALANKYGEIKVGGDVYHVPTVAPGRRLLVKSHWDRIEVMDERGQETLCTCPRHYMRKAEAIDWAAELAVYARRPRALEHAVYLKGLPEEIREFLFVPDMGDRRHRIRTMIDVLETFPLEAAVAAARDALAYGRTDRASVVTFAARAADVNVPPPLEEPWTPAEVAQWTVDLGSYDQLVMAHG